MLKNPKIVWKYKKCPYICNNKNKYTTIFKFNTMTRELKTLIADTAQAGAIEALRLAGVTSGEISFSKAKKTYGVWFVNATADGRLTPCRKGVGKSGTKWYSLTEILALKNEENLKAVIL